MSRTRYGLPYTGSKNFIAEDIVNALPEGERLVDLFGGGGAITHAALLLQKYNKFLYNDINTQITQLFIDAVNGKYNKNNFRPKWISREDFQKLKDTDPYVKYCWSFGNGGTHYMFAKELEPWKKALWFARVDGDCELFNNMEIFTDGSRKDIKEHEAEYKALYIKWYLKNVLKSDKDYEETLKSIKEDVRVNTEELQTYLLNALGKSGLTQSEINKRLGTFMCGHYFGKSQWTFPTKEYYEQLQTFMPALDQDYESITELQRLHDALQSLERLQRLESLQSLERLEPEEFTVGNFDYREYQYKEGDVVYCDIPYDTSLKDVYGKFDHAAFFEWAKFQTYDVYFSSYLRDDYLEFADVIWSKEKYSLYCSMKNNHKNVECLYKIRK